MLVYFHGRGAWFLNPSVNDRFGPRLSRNFVFKDPETGETELTDEFYRLYDSIEQRHCQEFAGVFRLSPKDAIIYSEKKDLSHVEKLLPCDHQYSAFSIAVEEGCISKEAFGDCFFMIQKTLDSKCFEHKPLIKKPYYLDNKLCPVGELDFADVFEEDIANKAVSNKSNPIKFERLYYTVEQLAKYWNIDISDVMQLGLTNHLAFVAQADWEYPDHQIIQRGSHTKINYLELSNIYHATKPFSETGVVETNVDKALIGSKCVITYYPGISHLIIDVDEVERFEKVDSEHKDDHLLESTHEHESNLKNVPYILDHHDSPVVNKTGNTKSKKPDRKNSKLEHDKRIESFNNFVKWLKGKVEIDNKEVEPINLDLTKQELLKILCDWEKKRYHSYERTWHTVKSWDSCKKTWSYIRKNICNVRGSGAPSKEAKNRDFYKKIMIKISQ